jgi:hypothetical protein
LPGFHCLMKIASWYLHRTSPAFSHWPGAGSVLVAKKAVRLENHNLHLHSAINRRNDKTLLRHPAMVDEESGLGTVPPSPQPMDGVQRVRLWWGLGRESDQAGQSPLAGFRPAPSEARGQRPVFLRSPDRSADAARSRMVRPPCRRPSTPTASASAVRRPPGRLDRSCRRSRYPDPMPCRCRPSRPGSAHPAHCRSGSPPSPAR